MWRTPRGEVVLQGAEWELFREGLSTLWDWVEESFRDPEIFFTNVKAFDRLQPNQKLGLLALVGKALRDEGEPRPNPTAHNEATVAAIFRQIRDQVVMEIELDNESDLAEDVMYWRRLVLAAYHEADDRDEPPRETPPGNEGDDEDDRPWSPPEVSSEDPDDWGYLVDWLAERILWDDDDYELGEVFLDADPDKGHAKMAMMDIPPDYFVEVAPDPTDEELESIRRTLRSLCGRSEPTEPELVSALRDIHHDLFVGPCDTETIAKEVACRLVEEVGVLGVDQFDCSHAEWVELFRPEVHRTAAQESPGTPDPRTIPSPLQAADAARARQSGEPMPLDDGHQIEFRDGGWIVADRQGFVLVELVEPIWADHSDDPDGPSLRFATPEEALAAYLQARAFTEDQSSRREAAIKQLGRD